MGQATAQTSVPAVIADAATGEVLYAEDATRPWFPASTTKLMTAYVALRAVQQGAIKFETPLVASSNAARQRPSKVGIKPGQEITVENALKILMVKSANDIAVVVAEGIGGSVPQFAALMNREAARLNMRESHFVNPHGLHDESQVSSARDMALLSRALLIEFPHYAALFSIPAVKLGERVYENTNGLIGRYSGAMGMKTGFICPSGFNLVSAAERNGRTLIAVVFGATTGADRTLKAAQLLDRGFSSSGGFWGSFAGGRTLDALTASVERTAPNRRAEVCGRRGPPASEEEDTSLAFSAPAFSHQDHVPLVSGFARMPSEASSVGVVSGGRVVLAPRLKAEPLLVYLGRKPGSVEIARLPAGMDQAPKLKQQAKLSPKEEPKSRPKKQGKRPQTRPVQAQPSANAMPLTPPSPRENTPAQIAPAAPGAASKIGNAKAAPNRPAAASSIANRPKPLPESPRTMQDGKTDPAVSAKPPKPMPLDAAPNKAKPPKESAKEAPSKNAALPPLRVKINAPAG